MFTPVGAPGAVVSCGVVKLPVLFDQLPLPTLLVARTSHAYVWLGVKPVTLIGPALPVAV